MPTVDGVAALATFQSYSNMTPGRCLEYTWLAYKAHGATSSVTYGTATDAFHASGGLHPGDYNPPAGFPVWFGNGPGDVCISAGNGMVSGVWYSGWHTVTIAQRAKETGRPYLGWTERFMRDNAIYGASVTGGGGPVSWTATDKQTFLNSLGLDTGGIDGQFGPKSQAATRTFQTWVGITADGQFGPNTIAKADVIKSGRNSTSRATTDIQAKVGTPADGAWGNKTSLAVYRWQAANGLTADAVWGPASDNKAFPPAPSTTWPTNGTNASTRPTTEIQAFLIRKGYDLGASGADGQYGPKTSVAVAQFQSSAGLGVDGIWGPKTDEAAFGTVVVPPVITPPNGNVLDPTAPWKTQTPDSALATWVGSPNYDYRASVMPKTHITLHWMTGTLASCDSHFQDPGTVIQNGRGTGASANYGVSENAIHQYVKEDRYVQSDGNGASNATTISIEHEGGWLLADGTRETPSKAVLDRSAVLVADIAKRQGWTQLTWMVNIFPHKHFVATECPGTLDYAYIIDAANKILGASPVIPPVIPPTDPFAVIRPLVDDVAAAVSALQKALG